MKPQTNSQHLRTYESMLDYQEKFGKFGLSVKIYI